LDITHTKATIYDSGAFQFSASTRELIGQAVAKILEHPSETQNRFIYINSFSASQNQVLTSLEKATGKKWEVDNVDSKEERERGLEMIKHRNVIMGIGTIAKVVSFSEGYGACFEKEEGIEISNRMLGLQEEDLDEVVRRIVKSFQ